MRKATISFVMSVPLFTRLSAWNNSVPIKRIFLKFDILSIFQKSADKIQVSLKPNKNNGYYTRIPMHTFITSRSITFRKRNTTQKLHRQYQNTHFSSNTFIPPKIVPFMR